MLWRSPLEGAPIGSRWSSDCRSSNWRLASRAGLAGGSSRCAIGSLGSVQGQVGQLENRLSYAIGLAQSQIVNNKAAESRIRDANIAEESANLTRYNILTQSGVAALAQANQQSTSVLALLR